MIVTNKENEYVLVTWPEVQIYMDKQGFKSNSYLLNDTKALDDFGSCAYFINKRWKEKIDKR